jgi:enoyl-CoA hydratase
MTFNAEQAGKEDTTSVVALESPSQKIKLERLGPILVVTLNRPEVRNAIDRETAAALAETFRRFEQDEEFSVAVLTGAAGNFCAGFDLKALAGENGEPVIQEGGDAPLGISRMLLSKPVIGAVEGYAVAGGLEVVLWCDLRVASETAVFGVYCRRWGVPLVDGGTIRLPRLIGQSHALDMILTGRGVSGEEALRMGLANRMVPAGQALEAALKLAQELARFPQFCMRSDRLSAYEQWSLPLEEALRNETRHGLEVVRSGETLQGAKRFRDGYGRHGGSDI